MIVHAPTPNVDHTVAVTLGPRSYNIRVVANDPAEFGPFARRNWLELGREHLAGRP